ncbi:family 78 glycoside hydrolase catalytic domain [bacterium]|nr:family 78 glycoside hydrolase catalytic domain [bacterium]
MAKQNPRFVRTRPECLDTYWAPGTGLIWHAEETLFYENPRNRFMRFRRNIDLPEAPKRAELRMWADTHYILWINGRYVGRGPSRSEPKWTRYDVWQVEKFLRPGHNVIAALCLFHGFGTGARISIMQGFMAHLEIEDSGSQIHHVVSDGKWKAAPAEEFIRPTPRLHGPLGCIEVQDGRMADPGWQNLEYDDSEWAPTGYVKPGLANTPWYHFVERDIPLLAEGEIDAPGVCWVGAAKCSPPPVPLIGEPRPFPDFVEGEKSAFPYEVQSPGSGKARVVTVDFGKAVNGLFRLDLDAEEGTIVDVLFGEVLAEGIVPKPGAARILSDRFIVGPDQKRLAVAFNWKAFRYAQLWIWSEKPVTLHRGWMHTLYYPLPDVPRFECDDAFLTKLDENCDRTLRLCMQDAYVDSSSREQQQWIGDGRKQALMNHYRFGDAKLHHRIIEQIGQGMDWMGSMVPRYPSGNVNVSPIPAYDLDWVCAFDEYYWFTGDDSMLEPWWPNIVQAMRWFTAFENEAGLLERVPYWTYIDVGEGHGKRGLGTGAINTTLNLYYLEALKIMVRMSKRVGDGEAEAWYAKKAERLAEAIRETLWDSEREVYPDAKTGNKFTETVSEVPATMALLHLEVAGSERAANLIRNVFEDESGRIVGASPLQVLPIQEALTLHERPDLALKLIRERYQEQMDSGATSTWEHWVLIHYSAEGYPACGSSSHAWGAAPMTFFSNTILGIRPLAPAWNRVQVRPRPLDLKRASGAIETPKGRITASWQVIEGRFEMRLTVPEGMEGEVVLPDGKVEPLRSGTFKSGK